MASGRSLMYAATRASRRNISVCRARAGEWRRMRSGAVCSGRCRTARTVGATAVGEGSHAAGGLIPTGGCAWILVREGHVTKRMAATRRPSPLRARRNSTRGDGVLPCLIGALTRGNRRVTGTAVAQAKGDGTVKYLDAILLAPQGTPAPRRFPGRACPSRRSTRRQDGGSHTGGRLVP